MNPEPRRTAVVGAGALGVLFAARLARAGHDVTLVSRRATGTSKRTLHVAGRKPFEQQVTLAPDLPAGPLDIVLLAIRAAETVETAWSVAPRLVEDGTLVPVQNGLVPLDVLSELGAERVVPCVVGFNAGLTAPDTVELTSPGGVVLATDHPLRIPDARRLVREIRGPVSAKLSRSPEGAVWSKWCVSCAINGLAVVNGTGVYEITRSRLGRSALVGLVSECAAIAAARGIALERVAGPVTPDRLASLPAVLRERAVLALGRRYRGVVPSSLAALRDGRDVELETLNGRAVLEGHQAGIATPWNAAVAELVRDVQQGRLDPGRGTLERLVGPVASRA